MQVRMSKPVGLAVAALFLAACSSGPSTPPVPQPAPSVTLPPEALNATWEWVGFTTPLIQESIDASSRYTITFDPAGRVSIQADCNRGTGTYTLPEPGHITFGPIGVTRMACPEPSQGDRFADLVQRSTVFFMQGGEFFLELPMDSGTLRFRRQQ